MEVSFYLKRPSSTTPTSIFARICYEGNKMKYYTPETILPKLWNTAKQRGKESTKFQEHPEFNKRLDNIETDIKNAIRKFINDNAGKAPTPTELKPLLDTAIRNNGKVDKITFMGFFADFIGRSENGMRLGEKGKPITHGTIKTYYTTKKCLENYQVHANRKIDFENIDLQFYSDFTKYLTLTVKQSTNYIGKHIKVIKTVLRDAKIKYKITVNDDFSAPAFKTITEKADTIYLPEYELKKIAELDLANDSRLDHTRDLFLIGCYTGLRFSDLSTLRPEQITGGMIAITQIKTGDKVVIPVHEKVSEIMAKYGGELPVTRSNQKTNKALKDMAKKCEELKKKVSISFTKGGVLKTDILEKWELVTTHTARRSFATNQYLNGVPPITIMAITGHKTESAFMKYIKVSPDDHAKILQGIWNEKKVNEVKRIAI